MVPSFIALDTGYVFPLVPSPPAGGRVRVRGRMVPSFIALDTDYVFPLVPSPPAGGRVRVRGPGEGNSLPLNHSPNLAILFPPVYSPAVLRRGG